MAAETIKVQADLRGFQKWAARAVGRQVPFATAKALTKTALEARDAVRAGLPARFEIRSTWTARGVTINPASKSDYPNAYAEVGTRHEWMVLQETGGAKAPKYAGSLAIPTKAGQKYPVVRRTSSGKIPKRGRPKALLKSGKAFEQDGEIRLRAKDGTAPPAFFLRPRATVRPRFEFRETVDALVARRFGPIFRDALETALKPRAGR